VGGGVEIVGAAVLGAGAGAVAGVWLKADRTVYVPVAASTPTPRR
jgi:hypothetical protein